MLVHRLTERMSKSCRLGIFNHLRRKCFFTLASAWKMARGIALIDRNTNVSGSNTSTILESACFQTSSIGKAILAFYLIQKIYDIYYHDSVGFNWAVFFVCFFFLPYWKTYSSYMDGKTTIVLGEGAFRHCDPGQSTKLTHEWKKPLLYIQTVTYWSPHLNGTLQNNWAITITVFFLWWEDFSTVKDKRTYGEHNQLLTPVVRGVLASN